MKMEKKHLIEQIHVSFPITVLRKLFETNTEDSIELADDSILTIKGKRSERKFIVTLKKGSKIQKTELDIDDVGLYVTALKSELPQEFL